MTAELPRAAETLRRARRILVLTGAGVSAESGVPTFRGGTSAAGAELWARYDPMQLATPEAFGADPALVTRWYDWRRGLVRAARPNPAHDALARLEHACAARHGAFLLATQNVDRLHQRAGSQRIVELHGTLHEWLCEACGHRAADPPHPLPQVPLPCPRDGRPMRPDVVWFGESLPSTALGAALDAARVCDVLLTVGTSAVVQPAAGLVDVAAASGATTIEVNAGVTIATERVDIALRGSAGGILPALVD